jgi:ubiquitin-activating enzyme E1
MVALYDNTECKVTDMCSNFYITEKDVQEKKSRAAACEAKLAELNNYVIVKCLSEEITENIISQFDLLVVSDVPR